MAVVYFDTSALLRRYLSFEPGAARVRRLCHASAGHTLIISRLTAIELSSALNRRTRDGSITIERRNHIWRRFRSHRRRQYQVLMLDEQAFERAEGLLTTYPLRAYDAVQLAAALQMADLVSRLVPDFRFCTADQAQADAARGEGLTVEFIS